ncbi:MAG TPA: DinB family protein [Alphaproteobacteria bacterium]|nr:DinB family protein [Alphaproteobacteria bacterium]
MLGATVRAIQQLSDEQLQRRLPWRERWTLRDLLMHVLSFPELAWLSHRHGSMSTDDMRASDARLREIQTSAAMAAYGEGVRREIIAFLQSNDTAAFDRVVPAHYGGEVTVLELLTIILSHSTHHLKQAYWFMAHELGSPPMNPVTDEDLEGIVTPAALF